MKPVQECCICENVDYTLQMFHPHVLDASEVEVHHSVGLEKMLVSNLFPIFNLCHILISYLNLNFVKKKSWSIAVPVLPSEIELEGMSNTIRQKVVG